MRDILWTLAIFFAAWVALSLAADLVWPDRAKSAPVTPVHSVYGALRPLPWTAVRAGRS